MPGVDGALIGLLCPYRVALTLQHEPEVASGHRRRLGVPGVDGPLVGRSCPGNVALTLQHEAEVERGGRRRLRVPGIDGQLVGGLRSRYVPSRRSSTPRLTAATGAASASPESIASR